MPIFRVRPGTNPRGVVLRTVPPGTPGQAVLGVGLEPTSPERPAPGDSGTPGAIGSSSSRRGTPWAEPPAFYGRRQESLGT